MLKCHTCHTIFKEEQMIEKKCPICGETHLEQMCPLDHLCTCAEERSSGIVLCPTCHQPTCPCGSHDVVVISRVTGYLSDLSGWNEAKKAEWKDRNRVNIG